MINTSIMIVSKCSAILTSHIQMFVSLVMLAQRSTAQRAARSGPPLQEITQRHKQFSIFQICGNVRVYLILPSILMNTAERQPILCILCCTLPFAFCATP